jgi:hypothetical protein
MLPRPLHGEVMPAGVRANASPFGCNALGLGQPPKHLLDGIGDETPACLADEQILVAGRWPPFMGKLALRSTIYPKFWPKKPMMQVREKPMMQVRDRKAVAMIVGCFITPFSRLDTVERLVSIAPLDRSR